MLEWNGVSAVLEKKRVLDGVSLRAEEGKITVLMGRNGSGKSTLLGCCFGTVPYSGRIYLCGEDIRRISPRIRARKLALFPQILPLTELTAFALVSLGRTPYTGSAGILSEADREEIVKAMKLVGADGYAGRTVSTLSGGERQRVYLAMMLAQGSSCLLLDEPSAFLDAGARRELYMICRMLRDGGKMLVMVMHDVNEAAALADSIAVMDGGRLICSGTAEQVLSSDIPKRIYGLERYTAVEDGRTFFL